MHQRLDTLRPANRPDRALDACDAYVVLIHDTRTGDTDAHGPFDGPECRQPRAPEYSPCPVKHSSSTNPRA